MANKLAGGNRRNREYKYRKRI